MGSWGQKTWGFKRKTINLKQVSVFQMLRRQLSLLHPMPSNFSSPENLCWFLRLCQKKKKSLGITLWIQEARSNSISIHSLVELGCQYKKKMITWRRKKQNLRHVNNPSETGYLTQFEWMNISMKWDLESWQMEDRLNQILCAFHLENEIYFVEERN